ncbi:Ku protein [Sphingorhabdus sp.]|uniref:non-homologous end joining protein Ku n=1 Tax=Sphingorhabdus sp. TaxID=1902408 RepID=UPI0039187248
MAARPYWQGQIRLALVSIPVEIYSATRSGPSISFRQIHEPSGKPIHYDKVVTGIGPVDAGEIMKGYEYKKGNYVLLDEDEIDAVKLESKKTLILSQFVEKDDIDPIYFEKPYYVVPSDDLAEEAFIVLREALKRTRKIGIGQLALRGREYIVSLKPCGSGLVLETLRYDEELHKASSYFQSIGKAKPDGDLLSLATDLIEKKSGKFDAGEYKNRYVDALKVLIDKKLKNKGAKIEAEDEPDRPSGGNVVDLMAALKSSLGESPDDSSRKAKPTTRTAKAAPKSAPATKRAPARKRA